MALLVKNLQASAVDLRDTGLIPVFDPLEENMVTHGSIFLPGESHGQRSLVGDNPWGCKESDTAERLTLSLSDIEE